MSAKAFSVDDGRFRELVVVGSYHSLGNFYSYITQICGFKAGKHEGKITGLAAHGDPRYRDLLDSLLTYRDGSFVNGGNIFFHSAIDALRRGLPSDFTKPDISASIQEHTRKLRQQFGTKPTTHATRSW